VQTILPRKQISTNMVSSALSDPGILRSRTSAISDFLSLRHAYPARFFFPSYMASSAVAMSFPNETGCFGSNRAIPTLTESS
jgi:hypothetical protein